MGKYEPLANYLRDQSGESWNARFSDVEQVLGFDLPRSAYEYQAWWANQEAGHSQTKGWRDAGWETCNVDLKRKTLRFERMRKSPSMSASSAALKSPSDDLWNKARLISGIEDRDQLMTAALTIFIQREAARQLGEIGGTMPDAEAPPRRRFFR